MHRAFDSCLIMQWHRETRHDACLSILYLINVTDYIASESYVGYFHDYAKGPSINHVRI